MWPTAARVRARRHPRRAAVALLEGKGGRIVLCGDTTVKKKTQIPAQSGKLEITSAGGRLILAMRLQFLPAPAPYDIVIDTPISVTRYTYYIFGGYNNVTFTENCKTTLKDGGKLGFFGALAVPAVVRFGYGFVDGAEYAAKELGLEAGSIEMKYTYTGAFGNSPDFQAKAAAWYQSGTECIFGCGGLRGHRRRLRLHRR